MASVRTLLAAALWLSVPADAFAGAGSTGMAFLRLGVGGRSLGMGEVSAAVPGDPASGYYNPAAIAPAGGGTLTFMHRSWIRNTSAEYVAGAGDIGSLSLGAWVYSVSTDDIEVREIPGPPVATFAARNAAIGLTAAYAWSDRVTAGLTVKVLYEKILIDDAGGFAIDAGATADAGGGIRVGASLTNLGSMSALGSQPTRLPKMLRAGAAYEREIAGAPLAVLGAFDLLVPLGDGTSHLHAGGEVLAYKTVALRAGYQTGYDTRGFSAGTGIRQGIVAVDYAFSPTSDDLGSTHAISLTLRLR